MKIKRTSATKIMSLATHLTDDCLLGVLDKDESLIQAFSIDEIKQLMLDYPQSFLIYNQSEQARHIKDQIESTDGQHSIEVFQDTAGVFGLRAYLQKGKIQTPITLELSD